MLLVLSMMSFSLQAQIKEISGTVLDELGAPLPGVSVVVKGTSIGTATDFDGKFSISPSAGKKTLVFSYLGYQTQEVTLASQSTLSIVLLEDVAALEEVVVIGYQTVAREKVLGSTTNVKSESIEQAAPIDVLQGVQGKVSGVQILSNNGPGEGFDIRIRGIGSLNGSTGPLYVVDGQQTFNIDNLNPSDIAKF